jgi:hypothetical protein
MTNGLNDFRHFGGAPVQAILELPEAAQAPILFSLFPVCAGWMVDNRDASSVPSSSLLSTRGRPLAPAGDDRARRCAIVEVPGFRLQ